MVSPEDLLTTRDVAKIFGVTPAAVSRWARKGDLPFIKVGGCWRFLRSDIEERLVPTTNSVA